MQWYLCIGNTVEEHGVLVATRAQNVDKSSREAQSIGKYTRRLKYVKTGRLVNEDRIRLEAAKREW